MPTRQAIIERVSRQDWRNTDAAVLEKVHAIIESIPQALFGGTSPGKVEYTTHRGQRVPIGFLQWWKVYPKKAGGLGKCAKAWLAAGLESRAAEMVGVVNKQKEYRGRRQEAGEFVPEWKDAIRWLKDERWTDELSDDVGGGPRTDLERMDALAPDVRQLLFTQATGGDYPKTAGMPEGDPAVRSLMVELAKTGGLL